MQVLWTSTEGKFFCSNVSKAPKLKIAYTLSQYLEIKEVWDCG